MQDLIKKSIVSFRYKWKRQDHINAILLGKILANTLRGKGVVSSLDEVEFRVFSQFGEDGIIQYLINILNIPNKIFIEFGVENYLESNTRFLLLNNNWKGLVIDGSGYSINFIKRDVLAYYRAELSAVQSFITKDNINKLIQEFTTLEDIGLLSVDIDGNDYWVLDAITVIKPRILICEYNSFYGPFANVTIPYNERFVRQKFHKSFTYFGASLSAIVKLANKKGYDFIGCESHGTNAFFVRKDLNHPFPVLTVKEGYQYPLHKEFRDRNNKVSNISIKDIQTELKDMSFFDTDSKKIIKGNMVFNID